jgi:hypothetical protein
MTVSQLTEVQRALVKRPADAKIFLEGPAGAGKTTAGVARMLRLLEQGVAARFMLVLVPQRTLAAPYYVALRQPRRKPGGEVTVATAGGLARRMVDLFWPLVAEEAGFGRPDQPPTFLTLETAQYYMAHVARPLVDQGLFEPVVIDRNRLYSQVLDNLNKAAVVGFPYTEIGQRLKSAWTGEESQRHIYDAAQTCASRFRDYCLAHNLLDFSLQMEVFLKHIWTMDLCREYLVRAYRHLIADNVEEDTPAAHELLREWLPRSQSALVIYDQDAGYRRFLGADPESAYDLRGLCGEKVAFSESLVMSPGLRGLGTYLGMSVNKVAPKTVPGEVREVLTHETRRYHPQMLDWVAGEIESLVRDKGAAPGEIVVMAPFLSDALRFSVSDRLQRRGIPVHSHRPSRALREETATRCLLTLTALAHPGWDIAPSRFDVAHALMQSLDGFDLVRAQLLAEFAYRVGEDGPSLGSFDQVNADMQERLTFVFGERYESLRKWIGQYAAGPGAELDHFLRRLFGEVLSQPGYGFHSNYDAGEMAARLIESVRKFRWVTEGSPAPEGKSLGQEYMEMVREGVVAAQYIRSWELQPGDAVLLAPAYTFLMNNQPVDYQFWLDVGGMGWWERLYQPLTHPYVLSRRWTSGAVWTDDDEVKARQDALYRLVVGLTRRCRRKVYLALNELNEQGSEDKGPLLQAVQRVLRRLPVEQGGADV